MSARSRPRGLAFAASGYFATQGLLTVAGLVSMPITTRLLSKGEYGVLNMAFATVGILVVIGQMGFPQATTRFYAERRQQGGRPLRHFCDNMVGGSLAAALLVALVAALAAPWIAGNAQPYYTLCLRLGCLVVVIRVMSSVTCQIYRAQERVLAYSAAQIGARYGTLSLVVLFLVWRDATASEVILATVIGEAAVVAICLVQLAAAGVVGRPSASWATLKAASAYGVPLAAAGSASFILDYGDRFLIERFLGLNAVATYAVPYDLAQNLAAGIFGPVRLAVIPIIFRLWASDGREATSQFVSQLFNYLIALAIPIGALFLVMNKDIILLLASAKYGESASLTPYLLPGVLLGEMNFLIASGLTIQKDTVTLAINVLVAGALNIVLNLVLLPRWGLRGAATATTISYIVLMIATYVKARPVLQLRLQPTIIGKAILATGIMVVLVVGLGPVSSERAVDIIARGAAGATVAAACMWIFDRDIRQRTWVALGKPVS